VQNADASHSPNGFLPSDLMVGLGPVAAPPSMEAALRQQKTLLSAVLDMVDELVVVLDAEGIIRQVNRTCCTVSSQTAEALRGRRFWDALAPSDEADLVRGVLHSALSDQMAGSFASDVSGPGGSRCRVNWTLRVLGDDPTSASIVLTGVDCRRREQHVQDLDRKRTIAEEVAEVLKTLGASPADATTPNGKEADTRSGQRRPVHRRQRIAPMFGGMLPSPRKFFEAECRDVGPSGIALVLERPPDFEFLVVELGTPPNAAYFTAQVVRVAGVRLHGRKKYLVGCGFTGKVEMRGLN